MIEKGQWQKWENPTISKARVRTRFFFLLMELSR